MSYSIKAGRNLKCTDGTTDYYLYEGDKVICHTEQGIYNGTLSWIGEYKENPDAELQPFVFIDTFESRVSMIRNIIKVKDIIHIYKNPFYDNDKQYSIEQDVLNTLITKGYSQKQAEAIHNRMSDTTMFYFIPYIKATTYALEAVKQVNALNKNDAKDIIVDAAKQCAEEAQKEYFELVEIYQKVIEQCDRDSECIKDTLGIVSKCWNDLEKQKTDKVVNTCAN